MKHCSIPIVALIAAFAAHGALAQDTKPPEDAKPAPKYRETPEDLKKWADDALAAVKANDEAKAGELVRGLILPNAETWFKQVFGDEHGAACATEYAEPTKDAAKFEKEIIGLLRKRVEEKQMTVTVIVAEGDNATGAQKRAIEVMKQPVKLYTVRFSEGDSGGFTLWSFVYVDGGFRWIGKLRALRPPPPPSEKP